MIPLLIALLSACPSADEPAPIAPTGVVEDAAYVVDLDRAWLLIGNDLTAGQDTLTWSVSRPGDEPFAVWLDGEQVGEGSAATEGAVDVADLPAGEYALLFALLDAEEAFAQRTFVRSHPLYVITSVDWDRPDTLDDELGFMDSLHEDHPDLVLTQFVGPYTFTEDSVDPARRDALVDWLLANEAAYGDEIGLHVHPYCSFVEAAGVDCRTAPSFGYEDGDESGYTVFNAAYTREENTAQFEHATSIFEFEGLGTPTTFRAGGWTADSDVLHALADAGYVADTSANNWALLEEWSDGFEGGLYDWNEEHWAAITDTSQPYYPADGAPDGPGEPSIPILEVPDNGILADYVEAEEMIAVLDANWDGGPLPEPRVLSIGFHNRTRGIGFSFRDRVRGALDHIDQHLARHDDGPLVYERLDGMARVWKAE